MRVQKAWSGNWIEPPCRFGHTTSSCVRYLTLCSEKEREQAELEAKSSAANKELQAAQTSLASLKAQQKAKQDEAKSKLRLR